MKLHPNNEFSRCLVYNIYFDILGQSIDVNS